MSRWAKIRCRGLPFSFRLDRRVPPVLLALGGITLALMVLSVGTGPYAIPPGEVVRTLLGDGSREYDFVIRTLRLPRALVAYLVGLALAMAGAILQAITRNPLASPDVMGLSAGASLGAVAVMVLLPDVPWSALTPAALAGGLVAGGLTYWLGWKGGSHPLRLVLVGIGIAAAAQALTNTVMATTQSLRVGEALVWLIGSIYGRSWQHLRLLLPWLGVGVPAALLMARHLDVLHLDEDLARGLGSRVEWHRGVLFLLAVTLGSAAVAAAGTLGFVGLMAPHIARRLVGPAHGGLLPTAGMVGGLMVLAADLIGRTLLAPIEIPAGVVTAAVGAPYFLYLLFRNR